jgi:lysophospholipase L1-like esterase
VPAVLVRAVHVLALGLCSFACGQSAHSSFVYPDDPKLRYVGWFDRELSYSVRFSWPGSQIHAQFTGSSVRARLADAPVEDAIRELDRVTVLIDDRPPKTFVLAEGVHEYPLANDLPAGTHRLVIWKRTEAEVGVISFQGLTLEAGASLVQDARPSPRRIAVIGDSISAGYGNEGREPTCPWSAGSENNYETYGAHAARLLAADYVAMAWSGKGLTRNFDARDLRTLPELWDRIIPSEDHSARIARTPFDAVVVNLGTNDVFRGLPDAASFVASYSAWLRALRERFPGALFVLALGPMLADDHPQPNARTLMRGWLGAAREARAEAGDARLDFIEFWFDPVEGAGCDFHPNLKTHARLGRELAEFIRARW